MIKYTLDYGLWVKKIDPLVRWFCRGRDIRSRRRRATTARSRTYTTAASVDTLLLLIAISNRYRRQVSVQVPLTGSGIYHMTL